MKKCLPIFLLLLATITSVWGQNERVQGTDYVRCYSVEHEQERRSFDENQRIQEDFELWMAEKLEALDASGEARQATYRVPYIVHVVHAGQAVGTGANLSEALINAQMQQTNEDFNRLNADATNTPAVFLPDAGSLDIEFVPALVDPDGNLLAEPGIERINGQAEFSTNSWTTGAVDATLKPNTFWDPNLYFNIWSCNLGGGILGFAQFPEAPTLPGVGTGNGAANTDGIAMAFGTFGSLTMQGSAGQYAYGRTITHELGHWAGLRHIWGDGGCTVDDFCDDTPTAGSPNYTGGACTFPGPNSCPAAGNDMFQNYMDYSDDLCMNLFTEDQANRMIIVFENSPRRNDLLTSNVWQNPSNVVTASFTPSVTGGCGPLPVAFTNESEAGGDVDPLNSWEWDFDLNNLGGASPSSFSGENPPAVAFATEGIYTVQLTVSNGTETDDYTFEITVTGAGTYDHLNSGTLFNELAANEGGSSGYVGGHNSFGDIAKADYFAEGAAGLILDYVDFEFAVANGATNLTCAIWDDNNGSPGAELATATVPISSITVGIGNLTRVEFGDIELNGPFYAGIKLNTTDGSEVALYTNTNGQTTPATAWEQFGNDDSWHRFDELDTSWGWDAALGVYATIVCPVVELNPPTANFQADATSVCSGVDVNFTDLSSDFPTSWSWDFGDGSTSTDQNPSHAYATGGSYTVSLTATNSEGADTEVKASYITVQTEPSSFVGTASETTVCSGEDVDLSMTGTFGAAYSWEVNGNVVANGMNTTVSPTVTTTYLAICDNGVCRVTDEVTITVNPSPATPTISVVGADLTASSTSTGTWQWSEGGTPIGGATSATYTATVSGAYTVTITDGNGCTSTSAVSNLALDPPATDFSADATTVCEGTSVDFTDLSTNSPTSWAWDFGDGSGTSIAQNPSYTYTTAGSYTVSLTATNVFGNDTETKTNLITVQAPPTGFAGVATPDAVCSGTSVALSMTGTFGGVYAWYDEDDNLVASGMNTTVTPTGTTTYTASCEAVCLVEADVTVTVNPLPTAPSISQNDFTLTATSGTSGGTYQWYLNGGSIGGATNAVYTGTEDGDYTVTVTDANGCVSPFSAITTISSTAVIDQYLDQSITVYPNPVSKQLTVNLTATDLSDLKLSVVDVMGRTLNEFAVTNSTTQINMENYAAGVYLIRLTNSAGHFTVKEVVKN